MLKLIKYEFRKALTSLLALLGLAVVLEGYFLAALQLEREEHLFIAIGLLSMCAWAVAVYVFVRGVTAYASELKSRSAYLIFMTPNSTVKIVCAKFLYTFVNGLMAMAICIALAWLDIDLLLAYDGRYGVSLGLLVKVMAVYGIQADQLALGVGAAMSYVLLSLLSVVGLAYLAITLSHTLLQGRKGRGLVALVIFLLLNYLVSRLNGLFPSALEKLVVYDAAGDVTMTAATLGEVARSLIPAMLISMGTVVLSLLGCAWLLERRISL